VLSEQTPSLLIPSASLSDSQSQLELRVNDLLEGLTELPESCTLSRGR
jgi:hypothetical protein